MKPSEELVEKETLNHLKELANLAQENLNIELCPQCSKLYVEACKSKTCSTKSKRSL